MRKLIFLLLFPVIGVAQWTGAPSSLIQSGQKPWFAKNVGVYDTLGVRGITLTDYLKSRTSLTLQIKSRLLVDTAITLGTRGSGAVGAYSFTSGIGNIAIQSYTQAHGVNNEVGTVSTGYFSSAIGMNNTVLGDESHLFGFGNSSFGQYNFGSGQNNVIRGNYGGTFGYDLRSLNPHQFIIGKFNDSTSTSSIFQIGYGWGATARRNIFNIDTNGTVKAIRFEGRSDSAQTAYVALQLGSPSNCATAYQDSTYSCFPYVIHATVKYDSSTQMLINTASMIGISGESITINGTTVGNTGQSIIMNGTALGSIGQKIYMNNTGDDIALDIQADAAGTDIGIKITKTDTAISARGWSNIDNLHTVNLSVGTSLFASTITGGETTTSSLTLKTTTGVGTTGANMHFVVGSNGGTEAMTILNSGKVGINNIAPDSTLTVTGSGNFSTNLRIGTTTLTGSSGYFGNNLSPLATATNTYNFVGSAVSIGIHDNGASSASSGGLLGIYQNDGAAIAATHSLGAINFNAMRTTTVSSTGATIKAIATELWTNSSTPTSLQTLIAASGSNARRVVSSVNPLKTITDNSTVTLFTMAVNVTDTSVRGNSVSGSVQYTVQVAGSNGRQVEIGIIYYTGIEYNGVIVATAAIASSQQSLTATTTLTASAPTLTFAAGIWTLSGKWDSSLSSPVLAFSCQAYTPIAGTFTY